MGWSGMAWHGCGALEWPLPAGPWRGLHEWARDGMGMAWQGVAWHNMRKTCHTLSPCAVPFCHSIMCPGHHIDPLPCRGPPSRLLEAADHTTHAYLARRVTCACVPSAALQGPLGRLMEVGEALGSPTLPAAVDKHLAAELMQVSVV